MRRPDTTTMRRLLLCADLFGAASARQIVIACAGDSVTQGGHGGGGDWPGWLEEHLEETGDYLPDHFKVLNLGRSGATAMRDTDRPYAEEDEYEELLDSGFDLAIVTLGTNDAKEEFWEGKSAFKKDYKRLIKDIQKKGGEVALGIPVPYLGGSGKWGDDRSIINEDLGAAVREVADDLGIERVVDFYGALGGNDPKEKYFHDPIHPNDDGYERLGLEALKTVQEFEEARLGALTPRPTPRPTCSTGASKIVVSFENPLVS